MNAETLYELFKVNLPKKEQQRFMRLLDTETKEPTPNQDTTDDLRMQILSAPKRKIPNVA